MRICDLTWLSLLLLASQVLTQKVKNGTKLTQSSITHGDSSAPLDKAQSEQRSRTSKSTASGKFISRDPGVSCTWVMVEKPVGLVLQVECTRAQHRFSCVFAGDPTECIKHHSKKVYWKQIARTLRKQKNTCGAPKNVLKAKVCKKNFPESNLRLISSTVLENMKPREVESKLSPTKHPHIKGASSEGPHKAAEDSSTPAVTKTATAQDPNCPADPDVEMQRKMALDFCGESWTSLCTFFLKMFQSSDC